MKSDELFQLKFSDFLNFLSLHEIGPTAHF